MENTHDGAATAARRDHIIALVARYPDLDSSELAELLHWFRKEASALEVGLIASDPRVTESYPELRKDHLDRLTARDLFWVTAIAGTGFAALALLVWAAL